MSNCFCGDINCHECYGASHNHVILPYPFSFQQFVYGSLCIFRLVSFYLNSLQINLVGRAFANLVLLIRVFLEFVTRASTALSCNLQAFHPNIRWQFIISLSIFHSNRSWKFPVHQVAIHCLSFQHLLPIQLLLSIIVFQIPCRWLGIIG